MDKKFGKIFVGILVSFGLVLSGGVAANAENTLEIKPQPRAINLGFVSREGEATTFDWMIENSDLKDEIGYYELHLRIENPQAGDVEIRDIKIDKRNKSITVDIPENSIAILRISTKDTRGLNIGESTSLNYTPPIASTIIRSNRGQQVTILSIRPLNDSQMNRKEVVVEWQPPSYIQYRDSISAYEIFINSINGSKRQSLKKTNSNTFKATIDLSSAKMIDKETVWRINVTSLNSAGEPQNTNSPTYFFVPLTNEYYAPCPDVQLIAARGSGEPFDDGKGTVIKGTEEQTLLTNEQVSEELPGYDGVINGSVETVYAQNLKKEITKKINPKTDKPYTFDTYAVPYPAYMAVIDVASNFSADDFWAMNPLFGKSINEGTTMSAKVVDRYQEYCPQTKIILSGYSQGALVMGDTIDALGKKNRDVDSVALFGDPNFNAEDSLADRSNYDKNFFGLLGIRDLWQKTTNADVISYCHDEDGFCNISFNVLGLAVWNPVRAGIIDEKYFPNIFAPHESYPVPWAADNNQDSVLEATKQTVKDLKL